MITDGSIEAVDGKLPTDLKDQKLIADVEQFLYFHRNADLTGEVLQVRLLLAILKNFKALVSGGTAQPQYRDAV